MIKYNSVRTGLFLALIFFIAGCSTNSDPISDLQDVDERYLSGGETTIFIANSRSFANPASNLSDASLEKHLEGDAAFEFEFVAAPAPLFSGLGPVFNGNTCIGCHFRDGRGVPAGEGEQLTSQLLRISIPGDSTTIPGAPNPNPGFGAQLQDKSLFGIAAEAEVRASWTEEIFQFADGESYSLRKPTYNISNSYQPLPAGLLISSRVAPAVFGRGLLEAIPEATLLQLADENDADGDGISGRPNYVWDHATGTVQIGRFGLKSNTASLLTQTAEAAHQDMGVTSPIFLKESTNGQSQLDTLQDDPEVDMEFLETVTFYTQTLAVPARRDIDDPEVLRGETLFTQAQCASCHVPELQTGILPGVESVSNQRIQPYSDLLLHDMGEGLADERPDFEATGSEWRTPPLWGIGLTELVSGHTFFLHDGRARNMMEAIMWHGGEAQGSKDFVKNLPKADRNALIAFVSSL